MKKLMLWAIAIAATQGCPLLAQNIVGSWQGTLQPPQGKPLRIIFKITRADNESLKAILYSIDQGGTPIGVSAATQQGSSVKLTIAAIGGGYEGKLNPDGDSITGTWTQGGGPAPLNLARATPATAWEIPEPPPPPKLMAANANPAFEVATIKPSKPDRPGSSLTVGPNGIFNTTNTTLADLIVFAYGLHPRQLSGEPSWVTSDKYDITGKPDTPGIPSVTQLKTLVQKLIVERFQLTFHYDKKELSVYAITLAKTGSKMSKSDPNGGNLPGFGGRGPGSIGVRNSTMEEFAGFLQSRILDRPVVDQSGLTDRFDFTLRWTPDSPPPGPGGAAAPPPPPPPDGDVPPDLFAAVQQQLGLKLEATKAPVPVMVVDKVQKPSEN